MVFTGKASPAQLAHTTVVMHRADVKRLLDRLHTIPPSNRSLLVTHTHIDGITDDVNPSDQVRIPDTGSLTLIVSTPNAGPPRPNPKNPVPSDAGVNSSSLTVPEPSVIQSTANDARLVPSSDSSHSDSATPIMELDSSSITTTSASNNSQLEAPSPPPPIPIVSSSSSRTFDPSTFEPKSARRPSQHALGNFSPLRQSWTSDDLFGDDTVFEEEDDTDVEDETERDGKQDNDDDDIKCKWVICGEEDDDEDDDELDDVNDLIKFFESRGRARTTKSFVARCDGNVNVGAGANVPAYVQVIVS